MIMKRILCLFACLLLFINIFGQSRYNIKGSVDAKFDNDSVYLFTFTENETISRVDTATIKNGSFFFTGESDLRSLALVSLGNYPENVLCGQVVLQEGTISVTLDSLSTTVNGTPLNDLYQQYLDSVAALKSRKESWSQYAKSFIKDNINNPIGKTLFIEQGGHWLNSDFFDIYNVADSVWRENKIIKEEYMLSRKQDEEEARRMAMDGADYVDFTFRDIRGVDKKMSDYVGKSKIVVFDVWASWCAPCRDEMPLWKELFAEYGNKGFLIVGISIDSSEMSWKNAVKKLELPWEQLIVSKEQSERFKQAYGIMAIPHGIAIGKDGKIMRSGLPAQLAKLFFPQLLLK